jgi:hypothetical protein
VELARVGPQGWVMLAGSAGGDCSYEE